MKQKFTYNWIVNFIPQWKILLNKFKDQPVNFLEIGCFEGKATCWFLKHILTHKQARITVIDTFEGGREHIERNIDMGEVEKRFRNNIQNYQEKVTIIVCESQTVLRSLKDQFDFIYIDGSHEAPDVLEDAINAWRLTKPGGIILFDDYSRHVEQDPTLNPGLGIDAFLSVYKGRYELIFSNDQLAIKKCD